MKSLLLMRHAKSSHDDPALDDFDRSLNDRGLRDAPIMGALIRRNLILPSLIIASSARRTLDTARAVADVCGYHGEIIAAPELYLASPSRYVEVLRNSGAGSCVLTVGHHPGVDDLLLMLTGQERKMVTAALAWIDIDIEEWSDLTPEAEGSLRGFWSPREVAEAG